MNACYPLQRSLGWRQTGYIHNRLQRVHRLSGTLGGGSARRKQGVFSPQHTGNTVALARLSVANEVRAVREC